VQLRTFTPFLRKDGSCCRLGPADPRGYPFRVQAVSPLGRTSRIRVFRARRGLWKGTVRFDRPGRWQVRVANYASVYAYVRVRPAVATPPPGGFAFLGRPGCDPPSPRNSLGEAFPAIGEVFGTALGGRLWALFFHGTWASRDSAVIDGVVGKDVKIVFRMTGVGDFSVEAVGPDGTARAPVSGPTHHPSSTWTRPGSEWGTQFVFGQPGCWRIHATHGDVAGDVWLSVTG
jgi:hypothetical protein